MDEKETKKWYDVILEYLSNSQTYQVVLTIFVAFGLKIDSKLQEAITKVGISVAQLGISIEELIKVINEQKAQKKLETK